MAIENCSCEAANVTCPNITNQSTIDYNLLLVIVMVLELIGVVLILVLGGVVLVLVLLVLVVLLADIKGAAATAKCDAAHILCCNSAGTLSISYNMYSSKCTETTHNIMSLVPFRFYRLCVFLYSL